MEKDPQIVLGIDVGGTFTDVLAIDRVSGEIVSAFKVPSTPSDPSEGAIVGVDRYLQRTEIRLRLSSTGRLSAQTH